MADIYQEGIGTSLLLQYSQNWGTEVCALQVLTKAKCPHTQIEKEALTLELGRKINISVNGWPVMIRVTDHKVKIAIGKRDL